MLLCSSLEAHPAGRGRYAILDLRDYEKTQATLKLMSELERGVAPGRKRVG